jgi:citrate synthase
VWEAPDTAVRVGRKAQAALPKSADVIDRMRVVVAALGPTDASRSDRRPEAVAAAARSAIAAAVDCLPERVSPAGTTIAQRLWSRLSDRRPTRPEIRALNAALVLLADHELAASTLAARIAASAWADPYLVLLTGLSVGGGVLHGAVSRSVEALLRSASTPAEARTQVLERLCTGERIPGFGHKVYVDHDPRADVVLDLVRRCGRKHPVEDTVTEIVELMASHGKPAPNVDLAIATLAVKFGLSYGSGEALFLLARMAGVIGHALEEYPHRLRFRPRALYTGPTAS